VLAAEASCRFDEPVFDRKDCLALIGGSVFVVREGKVRNHRVLVGPSRRRLLLPEEGHDGPIVWRLRRSTAVVVRTGEIPGAPPCDARPTRLARAAVARRLPDVLAGRLEDRVESDRDGGNTDVYVMNADGTDQTRLTTDPALDRFPMFSPDGSKIAFTSRRDGNTEIYVMNPDGTDQTDLCNLPGGDSQPNWSPDGTQIAWRRSGLTVPESGDVWVMNADGSSKTQLTTDPADLRPAWSPSGTKIVFRSLRTNQGDIYRMKADGTKATQLTDDPAQDAYPDWQPLAGGSDEDDR
jgi:dipeptidyl aminopeptidase/acylaminoacyl peptidase